METVGSILLTILLLSILVLVHEFGHFIAAKAMGIKVIEFALFMGPKIFSFKKGETLYSIRCIPLGGFCSMEGEEVSSDDSRAYSNKPWYKKALVLIAGPFMNLLLAFIFTIVLFLSFGHQSLAVAEVIPGSSAAQAGVSEGDKIVNINGMGVSSALELGTYEEMYKKDKEDNNGEYIYTIRKANGEKVEVSSSSLSGLGVRTANFSKNQEKSSGVYIYEVEEDGLASEAQLGPDDKIAAINGNEVKSITSYYYYRDTAGYPRTITFEKQDGSKVDVVIENEEINAGVNMYSINNDIPQGFGTIMGEAVEFNFSLIKVTVKSIVWLVTGTAKAEDVTGPVGMVSIVSDTVSSAPSFRTGLYSFMFLAVLISVNLGVFNILPFPALDGGRLIFALIEGIRGKKIKPEHEGLVSLVGFVILIGLSILVFVGDIIKLFK